MGSIQHVDLFVAKKFQQELKNSYAETERRGLRTEAKVQRLEAELAILKNVPGQEKLISEWKELVACAKEQMRKSRSELAAITSSISACDQATKLQESQLRIKNKAPAKSILEGADTGYSRNSLILS